MGHFDLVADAIENAGWYAFLSNLEDGYVIYHLSDDVQEELIFADWDVEGGNEHVRLIDPTRSFDESEIVRCDIEGSEQDILAALDEFFWNVNGIINA